MFLIKNMGQNEHIHKQRIGLSKTYHRFWVCDGQFRLVQLLLNWEACDLQEAVGHQDHCLLELGHKLSWSGKTEEYSYDRKGFFADSRVFRSNGNLFGVYIQLQLFHAHFVFLVAEFL